MDKTLTTNEWRVLVGLLREARIAAGLQQVDLARLLNRPQSLVSDIENGQRRVDVYELRIICACLGVSLETFVSRWEQSL